jgi:hypothetical protein
VSTLDHKLEPEVAAVCRLEVITGTSRRTSSPRTSRHGLLKRRLPPERLFRTLLAGMG